MMRFVLLALMVCTAPLAWAEGRPVDYIVAKVNDDVILASELRSTYDTLARQYEAQGNPLPPLENIERQLLDRMILNRVQLQRATQAGMDVTEDELDQAMRRLAARNNLSLNAFARALREEGLSYLELRRQVREDLILGRLRSREVESRVVVSERDVETALSLGLADDNTEYKLSHILISVADDAAPSVRAEALAKARRLREEHAQGTSFRELAIANSAASTAIDGGELGWRKGTELPSIVAPVAPQLQTGEVSEPLAGPGGWHLFRLDDQRGIVNEQALVDEVKARHILMRSNPLRDDTQTRLALEEVRQQIRDGADFEALARENSEDPGSVNQGGNLGWQALGTFDPAFTEALNALEPGELSPVFRSSFGWHIAEVLDRRQRDRSEDLRRAQVREAIFRRKVGEEFESWARRLRDEAFVEYQTDPGSA
jgi:peptidyl-prolyl cis-trans isomerase SurA